MKDVLTFPHVHVPSVLYSLCLFIWCLYFTLVLLLRSGNPDCLLEMIVRSQRTDGKLSAEQQSLSATTLPDCVLGIPLVNIF